MKTLRVIQLCGQRVEVIEASEDECADLIGKDGITIDAEGKVYIKAGLRADRHLDTYVHELLHVMFNLTGIGGALQGFLLMNDKRFAKVEEGIIRLLAPALITTFRAAGLMSEAP